METFFVHISEDGEKHNTVLVTGRPDAVQWCKIFNNLAAQASVEMKAVLDPTAAQVNPDPHKILDALHKGDLHSSRR